MIAPVFRRCNIVDYPDASGRTMQEGFMLGAVLTITRVQQRSNFGQSFHPVKAPHTTCTAATHNRSVVSIQYPLDLLPASDLNSSNVHLHLVPIDPRVLEDLPSTPDSTRQSGASRIDLPLTVTLAVEVDVRLLHPRLAQLGMAASAPPSGRLSRRRRRVITGDDGPNSGVSGRGTSRRAALAQLERLLRLRN